MKIALVTLVILALALVLSTMIAPSSLGQSSQEKIIFLDDFEIYDVGTFPSNGGWELSFNGVGDTSQIISDAEYVSPARSFRLWGKSTWSAVAQKKFTSCRRYLGYQASILIGSPHPGAAGKEYFGFVNRFASPFGKYYATVSFDFDTMNVLSEDKTILGNWTTKIWYDVKVILDRDAKTYDVWINGKEMGSSLVLREADPNIINALALQSEHSGVEVYYDDVSVFEVGEARAHDGGLVASWNFDEGSGNSASDTSGWGNNGQLFNDPAWVDGKHGKALSFNGMYQYVRIENSESLNITDQVTVETWINPRPSPEGSGRYERIISQTDETGFNIYTLAIYGSSYKVAYVMSPYQDEKTSVASLEVGIWTHLAMTYDGSLVKLYVNGQLDSSYALTGPIITTDNWLAIGCDSFGGYSGQTAAAYFNGTIDDVRIYNTALTQEEIEEDMKGTAFSLWDQQWFQLSVVSITSVSIVAVLAPISIVYFRSHRKLGKYLDAARAQFTKDVLEKREKIEKFEEAYGIRIRPSNDFDNALTKLGIRESDENG